MTMNKGSGAVNTDQNEGAAMALTRRNVTRRQVLKALGSGATALAVGEWVRSGKGLDLFNPPQTLIEPDLAAFPGGPSFLVRAVRRDDMFAVDLRFVNLRVIAGTAGPQLVRAAAGAAFVLLELPPQSVVEQATAFNTTPPPLGSVGTLLSGPSRLAFLVPAAAKAIPYRLDAILDVARLSASVVPAGQQRLPSANETHIEAPWDLVLSPDSSATWAHAVAPVKQGDRIELWHTRLVPRGPDGRTDDRPGAPGVGMRAVARAGRSDPPFLLALTQQDRDNIVTATSSASPDARPANARRLHLSALGASLTIDGAWQRLNLDGWQHRSTLGRDHYVRVDAAGYLAPFGHRATKISITERRFLPGGAYLFKREFIVVNRPVKSFPALGQPNEARRMPFRRVTITNTVSPNITSQEQLAAPGAYWPQVSGGDLFWQLIAEDLEGRLLPFSMPLVFVERRNAPDNSPNPGAHGTLGSQVAGAYQANAANSSRNRVDLQGRAVAFAPSGKPGDTSLEVSELRFGAEASAGSSAASLLDADQPNFYPIVHAAAVNMPAVEAIKGPDATRTTVSFFNGYKDGGFGAGNARSVYLKPDVALPLGLPAASVGGVAAPNLNVIGLSREFGAVSSAAVTGGIDQALNDLNREYNPADYFPDSAKLLGSLSLKSVLAQVAGAVPPAVRNENILPLNPATSLPDPTRLPEAKRTTLVFRPPLKAFPDGADKSFVPLDVNGLELVVTLVTRVAGPTESSSTVRGSLRNFALRVPPAPSTEAAAIAVFFDRLAFVSENGAKPSFDVALRDLTFGGPLTFVQEVRKFLKTPGSGLSIDVRPNAIAASYTLALPPVSIGVFALQNVALTAGMELPFDDQPVRLRFAFCSRERPFLLTFSLFAGGGFFAARVSSRGLELIEAALEFGAAASLDLGVASGSVSVMAGIYFKLEAKATGDEVTLGGYVRLNGSLEVLGLISISVEFYMGLTYESLTEKVVGRATLTVKVKVLFFSKSVSLSVERKFGGGGDPPFGEMVSQADWDTYTGAFAEVA